MGTSDDCRSNGIKGSVDRQLFKYQKPQQSSMRTYENNPAKVPLASREFYRILVVPGERSYVRAPDFRYSGIGGRSRYGGL